MVEIPLSFKKKLKKLQNLPPLEYHFFSPKDEKPMDGFCQPKPLLIHSKVNWRGEKKSERQRGRTALCRPMRPFARGLLDRMVRKYDRPIGRPASATTWYGGQPSRPSDRTARGSNRPLGWSAVVDARAARSIKRTLPRPRRMGPATSSARPGGRPECRRIRWTGPTDRTAPPLILR